MKNALKMIAKVKRHVRQYISTEILRDFKNA